MARTPAAEATRGSIPLRFAYLDLVVWAGLWGMVPNTLWWLTLAVPFHLLDERTPSYRHPVLENVLAIPAVILAAFVLLVAPSLVPCFVLWARQPKGARIEWDDDRVVEWDGPWRRATIPWKRVEVAYQRWVTRFRGSVLGVHEALQLRDRETRAVIMVWGSDPSGAPVVRRRIYVRSRDLKSLIEALERHDPEFERARTRALEHFRASGEHLVIGRPDWSLASDPDRPRPRTNVILGRFGYLCAVAAPMAVGPWPIAGYSIMALGTALLGFRAVPVFHEIRAVRARLAEPSDGPRSEALRMRYTAAKIEALLRVTFSALVVISTIIWAVDLRGP